MNISHENLMNNNFSNDKFQFYDKLGKNYNHAYLNYKTKHPSNKDFKKNVVNWLFSQDEETRMILCSIENKKYTNIIKDAYNKYHENKFVKFYLKDSENEKKVKLFSLNNSEFRRNDSYDYYLKEMNLIKDIKFYQCESPIDNYLIYSNYFTFFETLKNPKTFNNICDFFSNNKFLENHLTIEKDSNIFFLLPEWIYENNISDENEKYEYYQDRINVSFYYSFPKLIIALLEQVLSVRYLIYCDTKNLDKIISSVYLSDLFQKRNHIINYLTPKEKKFSYLYFKIDEHVTKLYKDENLKKFINKKRIKEQAIFSIDNIEIYFNEEDDLNNIILEGNNFFNKFLKDNTPKDFVDFFLFLNIKQIFTYDDFYFRGILEKIYETFLNQNIKDLIFGEEREKEKGKKKKKKKRKKNEKSDDTNEKEDLKNNNIDKQKEKNIEKEIDFGDEVLKILSESNMNENKNKNTINGNKNEELNITMKTKEENKINLINSEEKNFNTLLDNQKNITLKNEKKKNKVFFLYDATVSNKKKKKNKQNINNTINVNIDNINSSENIEKIEKTSEESSINEIKKEKDSIPLHINSITFSSTTDKSENEENTFIINNIVNQENFISDKSQNNIKISHHFQQLHNNIEEYYNILEDFLIIQRKIKIELVKYFSTIIKNVYNNAEIMVYGSSLYNLDIDSSDLDLSISTKENIALMDLEKYLKENNNNNQYSKLNGIFSASVPIIKLEIDYLKIENDEIKKLYELLKEKIYYRKYNNSPNTNYINKINIDISLNSINTKQTEFIKNSLNKFPEIIPLIKIIKKILQLKNMNNSYHGGMNSYCLFLLIYSYIKFTYKQKDNNDNNEINYGSLLIGILSFYTNYIDFNYTIIDPCADIPFIIEYSLETIPTIIEPISKQNASKTIYKIFDVVECLRNVFEDIYRILETNMNNNLIFQLMEEYSQK